MTDLEYYKRYLHIEERPELEYLALMLHNQPLPLGWESSIGENRIEYFWKADQAPQWENPNQRYYKNVASALIDNIKELEEQEVPAPGKLQHQAACYFQQRLPKSLRLFLVVDCYLRSENSIERRRAANYALDLLAAKPDFRLHPAFFRNLPQRVAAITCKDEGQDIVYPPLTITERLNLPRAEVLLFDLLQLRAIIKSVDKGAIAATGRPGNTRLLL